MKKTFLVLAVPFFAACAAVPAQPLSLSDQAPRVVSVLPETGKQISIQPKIAVVFSKPVDQASIGETSVLLAQGSIETDRFQNTSDLYKAIDKGNLSGTSLTFSLKDEGRLLLISSEENLNPSQTYTLLVTPRVLSEEHIPLVQEGSQSGTAFMASFQTGEADFVQEDPVAAEIPSSPPPDSPSDANPPQQAAPIPVGMVVLNEIYYDAVGSDTDGFLFVELYGTPGFRIAQYKVNFVNGDDGKIYDSVTLPDGAQVQGDGFYLIADTKTGSSTTSNVAGADLLDNFDPQNGPDAVQLVDGQGKLVDAVGYGEGIVDKAENGLAAYEGIAAPDVINGHSIERISPGQDTDNNQNDWADREVPTPGH